MVKHHNFSLIEIMIALGIVLVGICSIMVLFPIGANASRDAAVEVESSQVAEQLMAFIKYTADKNITEVGSYIASSEPGAVTDIGDKDNWDQLNVGSGLKLTLYRDKVEGHTGVYQYLSLRSDKEEFSYTDSELLTDGKSGDADGKSGYVYVDKRFLIKVWYKTQGDRSGDLNIEVSWPAEAPEASRQTSTYLMQLVY